MQSDVQSATAFFGACFGDVDDPFTAKSVTKAGREWRLVENDIFACLMLPWSLELTIDPFEDRSRLVIVAVADKRTGRRLTAVACINCEKGMAGIGPRRWGATRGFSGSLRGNRDVEGNIHHTPDIVPDIRIQPIG